MAENSKIEMSGKERTIKKICSDLDGCTCSSCRVARSIASEAYDAGYAAALERAAGIARETCPQRTLSQDLQPCRDCRRLAAAIEREKKP